jgi:hypothetical protein
MFVRRLIIWGTSLIVLAACSSGGSSKPDDTTRAPTRTLNPPTPTPTPLLIDTTPTPTDLPSASALGAVPTEAITSVIPAAAQAMIDQTMRDLAAQPGVNPEDIRLLSLDAFSWRDESWGCPARYEEGYTASTVTPGYRIVFSAGPRAYVYHTDRLETFFVCETRTWLAVEGEPIPLDPIEESMVELSARDAAKHFEVPESDVRLVSLVMVDWPDSSVGCPKPNADYAEVSTPGYRMVFRAGQDTLIYHTSIRDVVRCTPDEEILPGLLRAALPTPEPEEPG